MSKRTLDEALKRLHAELKESPRLDAASRELLDTVTLDIERARGESGGAAHASRLEELAVRFESEYPELAASLRGIADALGRIGL